MTNVEFKPHLQLLYTSVLSSITVREEITKPLNNYFSYRFVSFVSLFLLRSRGAYSSCHCDLAWRVTSGTIVFSQPSSQEEIKIYPLPKVTGDECSVKDNRFLDSVWHLEVHVLSVKIALVYFSFFHSQLLDSNRTRWSNYQGRWLLISFIVCRWITDTVDSAQYFPKFQNFTSGHCCTVIAMFCISFASRQLHVSLFTYSIWLLSGVYR